MPEIAGVEWDDWLEGHLFDRRVLVLRGPLDDRTATRAASQLMTLDAVGDAAVQLQLDSPGGSLEAAFAVIDVIDALGVSLEVLCLGRVEGAAVAVAAAGHRRTSLPHTRFRLADPDVAIEGRAADLERLVEAHRQALARYHERLAAATGRSVPEIEAACREGRWLDAAEAKAFGLVDDVGRPKRANLRPLRP
jgi:ATP-dependent Clp protease protease subunit